MYLPPFCSIALEDPGHTQRPILVWQSTDLSVLSFNHHQHSEIVRRIALHNLHFRFAVLKKAFEGFETLGRCVEAALCRAAEG